MTHERDAGAAALDLEARPPAGRGPAAAGGESRDDGAGRRLGYLSAAPTVSTRPDAASAGPRAHIQGVIAGFREAGWQVRPFIVGDRMRPGLTGRSVQSRLEGSRLVRYAADAARLAMAEKSRRQAWRELAPRGGEAVDWVYERFATMQVLGHPFRRAGIPWILETQGLFYYETRVERASVGLSGLAERIEKRAYRLCDILVCISPALKELIVRECGVDPEKIMVVPNAVELDRFDPHLEAARTALKGGPGRYFDELTLGFVGGLIGWQALDQLIDAMAELDEEGVPLALVVIGDGAMRGPWEERAQERGLAHRVRFLGHVPAPAIGRHMAGIDLGYAGARVMEIGAMYHSPIKLYEYMAMAKPVVAAAFDDARRLVEVRGTGFLFEAGAKESLKAALREAHAARAGLAAMGDRARALIEAEHTWRARARGMIEGLERRLDRPAPAGALGEAVMAGS